MVLFFHVLIMFPVFEMLSATPLRDQVPNLIHAPALQTTLKSIPIMHTEKVSGIKTTQEDDKTSITNTKGSSQYSSLKKLF